MVLKLKPKSFYRDKVILAAVATRLVLEGIIRLLWPHLRIRSAVTRYGVGFALLLLLVILWGWVLAARDRARARRAAAGPPAPEPPADAE